MKLMRTTIFLVLAIAVLGAVGVTTAIMSSGPTPAYAAQSQAHVQIHHIPVLLADQDQE